VSDCEEIRVAGIAELLFDAEICEITEITENSDCEGAEGSRSFWIANCLGWIG
jgi:hypothetical protein